MGVGIEPRSLIMYDHIVIPIDGSDEAKGAARRGLELARTFDATVDVLHVIEGAALRLATSADEKRRLLERGDKFLTEIEEIATEFGQPISTELAEGKPGTQISEYAANQNATLIVVGRQGMTGLGKRLLGGVTEQVLHHATTPVLVVPECDRATEAETGYSRVLIPTDGSENAEAAAPHGVAIARQYGSTVHVLNVVDLQSSGGVFNAGGLETEFVERLEARGNEAVDRVVNGIDDTAPGLDVESAVVRTNSFDGVAAGVREYVSGHDIDLVVVGSHGRSNIKRRLLGSVASTLLRTLPVPVLVVDRSAERT